MPAREYAGGQIVANQPSSRSPDSESSTGVSGGARALPAWSSPTQIALVVCIVLGFVSVVTLPSLPSYDPFAWVVWGRELAHHIIGPHEAFITGGGPSWKPFPVIFTTVFGFFGAAPKLWVAVARAGGLFGLFVAYQLGSRLAASPRWRLAGPIAGVLSAVGVFLTSEWTHYMYRGTSEPLVVTTTLFAIERHLAGRRTTAFLSGVALALMRPEAGVFVGLYALWIFFADPRVRTRLVLVAGIAAIPVGWFVPPWIASGEPFLSSKHAQLYNGQLGAHPQLEVLKRATNLSVWPVIVAALAVTLLAIRKRDWLTVTFAAGGLAYVAVVEAMTLDHYPGLERFMLPGRRAGVARGGRGAGGDRGPVRRRTHIGGEHRARYRPEGGLDLQPDGGGRPRGRRHESGPSVREELCRGQPHGADESRLGARRAADPRAHGDRHRQVVAPPGARFLRAAQPDQRRCPDGLRRRPAGSARRALRSLEGVPRDEAGQNERERLRGEVVRPNAGPRVSGRDDPALAASAEVHDQRGRDVRVELGPRTPRELLDRMLV